MGDKSKIQWTEATWNPVRGCTKVSPGCLNCYAEEFAERWRGIPGHPYEQGFDLRLVPEALDLPLRWKRPRRIFVNSMSDLFHEGVPEEYIGRVWSRMLECPRHTFQVLTKRSRRMREIVTRLVEEGRRKGLREPTNIVGMVTAEDQRRWDERVPDLLATPFCVRGVSVEPMLGPIEMGLGRQVCCCGEPWNGQHDNHYFTPGGTDNGGPVPDWIILGGESGRHARPCNVDWIRSGVRQCREAGVKVFVKQLGAKVVGTHAEERSGAYSHPKGGDPAEWPEDLRVREVPECDVNDRNPDGIRKLGYMGRCDICGEPMMDRQALEHSDVGLVHTECPEA